MVDIVAIMFSTLGCLFMIFRAIRLDRLLPWVEPPAAVEPVRRREVSGWTPDWESALPDRPADRG